MSFPAPRTPVDDSTDRDHFLAACAHVWDYAREGSRAQMTHAATMILARLGGALILRGQTTKRSLPEAGFISEGLGFADLGSRRLD